MNAHDVAQDLVAMCREGKFAEAGEIYWADDVVSVEAMGDSPISHGKVAARAKGEWWSANHDIHSIEVEGPYINGEQFTIRFKMDVTMKATNQRLIMDEHALYTVKEGKIVEERFFYGV